MVLTLTLTHVNHGLLTLNLTLILTLTLSNNYSLDFSSNHLQNFLIAGSA